MKAAYGALLCSERAQEQRRLQASGPKGTIINMAFLGLESGALAKGHHSPAAALRWSYLVQSTREQHYGAHTS